MVHVGIYLTLFSLWVGVAVLTFGAIHHIKELVYAPKRRPMPSILYPETARLLNKMNRELDSTSLVACALGCPLLWGFAFIATALLLRALERV